MAEQAKSEISTPKDQERRLYRYWINQIKRAKNKQPRAAWDEAMKRYTGKDSSDDTSKQWQAFVSGFRLYFESAMSFLDQQEPTFRISPEPSFLNDMVATKTAECDNVYIQKVWREQDCQKRQSQKLSSALIKNIGFTMPIFDVKKWMPSLRYLPAEKVFIDPDCCGLMEDATWVAFCEDIPAESFRSMHAAKSNEAVKNIIDKAGSTLTESEQQAVKAGDEDMYKVVRVYHIYARNNSAVREPSEKGDAGKDLPKDLADDLQLTTPRRYMQIVEGYPAPIVDEPQWPYDLDHDEFPVTPLQFNLVPDDLYGFTDHSQMQIMDDFCDTLLEDLAVASKRTSNIKYLGSSSNPASEEEVRSFLNNKGREYLENMLDAGGNPKIKPMESGTINPNQTMIFELFDKMRRVASGVSEILNTDTAQAMKDVTAIAARIADANMQQRINRRLGGPRGYEKSIQEDCVKMLEIAHQFVPKLSSVAVKQSVKTTDPMTGMEVDTGQQQEVLMDLPWADALSEISKGGRLIKLGIDAIVGQELAQYWLDRSMPNVAFRLSTQVAVVPGSTRSITKEQKAAVEKQIYLETAMPLLQTMNRPDLMARWIEDISRDAGIEGVEHKLPSYSDIQQFMQQQQMMMQQQQAMAMAQQQQPPVGEAGGQPLNSPDANGGEVQEEAI